MSVVVVDASAVILAVVDRTAAGQEVRRRLVGIRRHAPHLIDAEVGSVLRRMTQTGEIHEPVGRQALRLARRSVHRRHDHGPLMGRAWAIRDNVTFHDAMYVALAEQLGCAVVTADQRLARAIGDRAHLV